MATPSSTGSAAPIRHSVDFSTAAGELGFEIVPIMSVWATPSGMVTADAIQTLLTTLKSGLIAAGTIDGVLLGLHGAMVTEIDDDGDALILETVRDAVGSVMPVVATLDLHANISQRMVNAATALIGYDTYPHVDMAERAIEAAELIVRIARGDIRPVMELVKPPMAPTSQNMPTNREPMRSLIARAHDMEALPDVLNVTIAGGFPPSDSADTGASIVVTTDGDRKSRRSDWLPSWRLRCGTRESSFSVASRVSRMPRESSATGRNRSKNRWFWSISATTHGAAPQVIAPSCCVF